MFMPRNRLCGIVHTGIHTKATSTLTTRHATTCLRQSPLPSLSLHTSSGPARSSIPSTSSYTSLLPSTRHKVPGTRGIITGTYPSTPLNRYNRKLITLLKDPQQCLPIFDKCREIKELNLKPDLTTYTVLLEAHERNNDLESIMKTLEEMELIGIQPSISAFNIALRAAGTNGDTVMLEKVTELIHKAGLQMNINSYEIIIQGLCANSELEHALDILGDMTVSVNQNGHPDENGRPAIDIRPSLQCFLSIIQLAQSLHETETAYLVLKMAEVQAGLSRIPAVVYTDLMAKAAEDYLLPAVEYCWRKGVKELGACPDEGSCMLILNCAAHEKAPQLSAEVIQFMGENDMDFQEYHFAPLLQAFSLAGKYKSAFNVLSIMRTSGMKPTILTATSLLKVLDEQGNIDDAYTCMKEMHQEGKAIDVVAFNVLIEACGRARNLTQAMSIFDAASSLSIEPDTDTYNALLTGCITDRNMSEGKNVILMMQSARVDPNVDTYQSLITLCLTQINYEDAFMYLEEMKSHNVIPSESIYTSLVRKLARENDPRITYAVEEMESFGYVVGANLREYIDTGGLSNLEESERRKRIRVSQRRRSGNRPHF
ncbi:hypothetical protein BGZ95_009554 [Linnemannia exigua]|uniref:Pentatricopeptide repeat-containing protein-mitochondrial domain-containing protein n=1 Tax=Linnemannia exigua TaxID=604196 RepID=A0AAD4DD07_9FUNG|nr:hypothetical protein BGZ95_009554 [Linnemannia exigua]